MRRLLILYASSLKEIYQVEVDKLIRSNDRVLTYDTKRIISIAVKSNQQ
jgi:hypothetical protein